MTNTLNWAIMGTGEIAYDFAKAIQAVNGKIYAVAARRLSKAQAFADQYQIDHVYDDFQTMLQQPDIDVVYIATPHSSHYKYIIESLHHQKHVFCEKAITVNSQQLAEIQALATKQQRIVAEAMTIYHMPLYKQLRTILDSGQLGTLKMVQVSFGSAKPYDVNSRFFNPDLAGGALLDIGTYALSFARYFLSSQPHDIVTTVKTFETGVDEQSGILLQNKDNELAVISLTMRAKMPKRGVVAGELGFITVDDFPRADHATITYLDGRSEVIQAGHTEDALKYEVEHMNNIILNAQQETTLPLSIDVMQIMSNVRQQWGISYPFE